MSKAVRVRLSAMMFLQYFVNGSFLPILSHYLKNHLDFDPFQVGVIMAMPALAAIVAPFIIVHVADRLLSAERLLALNHFLSAGIMALLFFQTQFWPWLVLYLVYGLLFVPTFALTNAVAFHHVEDPKRDFGLIRLWGPVSWVVVGWGFGYLWLRGAGEGVTNARLPQALALAAISSLVLAVYALLLPPSKVEKDRTRGLGLLHTLSVFRKPNMALLCVVTLLNAMVHQFYYYGMSPFMSQIGFADSHIMPAMSMGQLGEVFTMLLLGWALHRFGVKKVLMAGVLAQVIRTIVFAVGYKPLVLAVIPSHGVCYAFYFAVAYIYVDQNSSPENRAGAQQLFNILIAGVGNLAGNLFAGATAKAVTVNGAIDFTRFWLVSAVTACLLAAALSMLFKERPEDGGAVKTA